MLNWLVGWKGYVIGAGLALVASWGYGQWKYQTGHADAVQEQKVAGLEKYKQAANNLLTASQKAQTALDATQAKFTTFQEVYQNEMRVNPIDCVGTDGRLRSILDLYPPATAGKSH